MLPPLHCFRHAASRRQRGIDQPADVSVLLSFPGSCVGGLGPGACSLIMFPPSHSKISPKLLSRKASLDSDSI